MGMIIYFLRVVLPKIPSNFVEIIKYVLKSIFREED